MQATYNRQYQSLALQRKVYADLFEHYLIDWLLPTEVSADMRLAASLSAIEMI